MRSRDLALRALCFLACLPSGGALLAKVFGLASVQFVTVAFFVPASAFLLAAGFLRPGAIRRSSEAAIDLQSTVASRSGILREDLAAGFVGGLAGTIGYDLFRIPFHLLGFRVFAQHAIYGMWIVDADVSTRYTDVLGWLYHFSNGITFGIMYALVMPGRRWFWAVPWALLLESIAIFTPFGHVFSIQYNYPLIAVAYAAHVAYGVPLGLVVQRWDFVRGWLARLPRPVWALVGIVAIAPWIGMIASPGRIEDDRKSEAGRLLIEGTRLLPNWQRISGDAEIILANPSSETVVVEIPAMRQRVEAPAKSEIAIVFPTPGIYQLRVETPYRTRSSFVAVEPVENKP